MPRAIKVAAIVVGIFVIVVIAGYLLVKAYVTPEMMRSVAEKTASEVFHRPVTIGRVGLKFGFKIGIVIEDMSLPNVEGFSPGPLLEIDEAVLNLRLLPLLRRQVVIGGIDVSGMTMKIERASDGTLNIVPLIAPQEKGPGMAVTISTIAISGGTIEYSDKKDNVAAKLEDINQQITMHGATILARGTNTVHLLKYAKLPEMVIKTQHDIEYDSIVKTIRIKKMNIIKEPIILDIRGMIEGMKALQCTGSITIKEVSGVTSLISSASRPERMGGSLKTTFSVSGTLEKPVIDGTCTLTNIMIVPKGLRRGIEKINGTISFDVNSVRSISIQGMINNARMDVRGSVQNLKKPLLNITTTMQGDLRDFESLTDAMKEIHMSGPLSLTLTFKGGFSNLSYVGDYTIKNATIDGIGLGKPITILIVQGTVQKDAANVARCSGTIGRSDFSFSGHIVNFKEPVINITNTSKLIDLDELLPQPKRTTGKTETALPVTLCGVLTITTLTGMDMVFKNVATQFSYTNGIIDVKDCVAQTFDGSVKFDFYYDANSPEPYRINTKMTSVSAKKVLARFIKFENLDARLSGIGNFQGNGLAKKNAIANLSASGNFEIRNGMFHNFGFLTKLLAWLGMKDYKDVSLSDGALNFTIDNGKARIKDWTLSSTTGNFLVNGTVGLTGTCDLDIAMTLSKQSSDIVKRYHGDWLFPVDKQGRATIDIIASGTLDAPNFGLDKAKIQDRLKGKLKDQFEEKKDEWESKLKNLFGK